MRKTFAIIAFLALTSCADSTPTIYLRDDDGRAMILHGVNVGNDSKNDPLRVGNISVEMVERFQQDWGFNAVRMLVFWDAIEPNPGIYDTGYFQRVEERLDWYEQNDIKVILDMHQDVYSSVFCCDGAPTWAVQDDNLPFVSQPIWWQNYNQPAVIRAFDNFWDHTGPYSYLQEHYLDAWMALIERVKDHPAVLGYDLMNEPNEGSGHVQSFEKDVLAGFYQRLINKIREVDVDNWIFYEPLGELVVIGYPSKLPKLTDPREGEPRLGFFPHLYEPTLSAGVPYFGLTIFIDQWVYSRRQEMNRLQSPVLIGEFGEDENKDGFNQYLADLFSRTENSTSGWFLWNYDVGPWGLLDEAGNENQKLDVLVQPYPAYIAGDPTLVQYNVENRTLRLHYNTKTSIRGNTEIVIPERIYPDGWNLTANSPDILWYWNAARQRLIIQHELNSDNADIQILLRPQN